MSQFPDDPLLANFAYLDAYCKYRNVTPQQVAAVPFSSIIESDEVTE